MEGMRVSQAAASGGLWVASHRSRVRVTSDPVPHWPAMSGPSGADIQPPDAAPCPHLPSSSFRSETLDQIKSDPWSFLPRGREGPGEGER